MMTDAMLVFLSIGASITPAVLIARGCAKLADWVSKRDDKRSMKYIYSK